MPPTDPIAVLVVYALPDHQACVELALPAMSTVAQAVERSGLAGRFAEIATREITCAIFNRVVVGTEVLRDGDRVEILRPLRVDPKEGRRRNAARTGRLARKSPKLLA